MHGSAGQCHAAQAGRSEGAQGTGRPCGAAAVTCWLLEMPLRTAAGQQGRGGIYGSSTARCSAAWCGAVQLCEALPAKARQGMVLAEHPVPQPRSMISFCSPAPDFHPTRASPGLGSGSMRCLRRSQRQTLWTRRGRWALLRTASEAGAWHLLGRRCPGTCAPIGAGRLLLNRNSAAMPPARDPYTTLRSDVSMAASHF